MRRPKRPRRRPVTGGLRANSYAVLHRAIEDGLDYGWMRAHKHSDHPDEATIKNEILQGIMNELCQYFDFDAPPEGGR